jgi:hypothetical protein
MNNEQTVEITIEEYNALNALVYAVRAEQEGHSVLVTSKEVLATIDQLRFYEDDNQGDLFESNEKVFEGISWIIDKIDDISSKMQKLTKDIDKLMSNRNGKNKSKCNCDFCGECARYENLHPYKGKNVF